MQDFTVVRDIKTFYYSRFLIVIVSLYLFILGWWLSVWKINQHETCKHEQFCKSFKIFRKMFSEAIHFHSADPQHNNIKLHHRHIFSIPFSNNSFGWQWQVRGSEYSDKAKKFLLWSFLAVSTVKLVWRTLLKGYF